MSHYFPGKCMLFQTRGPDVTKLDVKLIYHLYFHFYCTLFCLKISRVTERFVLPHREFLALVSSAKARSTNMNCEVTCMVKHDKSEPVIDVTYGEDRVVCLFTCVGETETGIVTISVCFVKFENR